MPNYYKCRTKYYQLLKSTDELSREKRKPPGAKHQVEKKMQKLRLQSPRSTAWWWHQEARSLKLQEGTEKRVLSIKCRGRGVIPPAKHKGQPLSEKMGERGKNAPTGEENNQERCLF